MENREPVVRNFEVEMHRIENRVNGMQTELRSTLNEIQGEIEEVEVKASAGHQRSERWLKGIFFTVCGAGTAMVGLDLMSRMLHRQG
jgi:hypothetical protein